ncbi:MAG TPA: hypothetical protein VFG11_11515 [Acidobacteriota bacterium]|nr:hypothetical protein [Acidobacteriota bacterium]
MSCERFETALYEGASTQELSTHLEHCPSCNAIRQKLQSLDRHLRFNLTIDPQFVEYQTRLISQKIQPAGKPASVWGLRVARLALGVGFGLLLLSPLRNLPGTSNPVASGQMAQVDFALEKHDATIELRWKGVPGRRYRVYRGSNPGQMRAVSEVRGDQWVDPTASSDPIVFYRIEAL